MTSAESDGSKQRLEALMDRIGQEETQSVCDAIQRVTTCMVWASALIGQALFSKAVSDDHFPEPCAELASALRLRFDTSAPSNFICELMELCQNELERLLYELDVADMHVVQTMEVLQLVRLVTFMGHMYVHRAIRGNSIIQSLLNALLHWVKELSRWEQGPPKEHEVKVACALLRTVGFAYVGKTKGSSVYLSRLKMIKNTSWWLEETKLEIAALIQTWEQEWFHSRVFVLSRATLAESTWKVVFVTLGGDELCTLNLQSGKTLSVVLERIRKQIGMERDREVRISIVLPSNQVLSESDRHRSLDEVLQSVIRANSSGDRQAVTPSTQVLSQQDDKDIHKLPGEVLQGVTCATRTGDCQSVTPSTQVLSEKDNLKLPGEVFQGATRTKSSRDHQSATSSSQVRSLNEMAQGIASARNSDDHQSVPREKPSL
mmetsp:Transcript_39030/g.98121  ORF Transcript_39030/g.98121 Transcript_39030/m.98121 type:complete len:432 (+) Transcript_39030:55-1350(+)